ncbi:MAG: DUF6172 family protein [Rhodoferax sp.]|nr:DUF6172 family protein [Rhodoferax sp.]
MKKTFQLWIDGKNRDRVLEATKHEIRQYMKRERNKALPEGMDFWHFDCRFGLTNVTATEVHPAQLSAVIDAAAKDGAASFYLEILAKPTVRTVRTAAVDHGTALSGSSQTP